MDFLRRLPWLSRQSPEPTPDNNVPGRQIGTRTTAPRAHIKRGTAIATSKVTTTRSKSTKSPSTLKLKLQGDNSAPGFTPASEGARAKLHRQQAAALERLINRKRKVDVLEQAKLDKELAAKARDRWNPNIDPSSDEFAAKVAHFREALTAADDRAGSLDEILPNEFTPHERNLLFPADRDRNPSLVEIQKRNEKAYSELVRSKRFKKWMEQGGDQLPFKLTMLWYGLPVAPLRLNYWRGWGAYRGAGDSEDETETEEWMKGDETEPESGRLRFLNKYHARMYEWDGVRDADPTLEAYYAFQRIRERGNNDPVVFGGAPQSVGLRGGGFPEENGLHGDYPTMTLRGGRVSKQITVAPDESPDEQSDPDDEDYEHSWPATHGLPTLTPDLGYTVHSALEHGQFEVDKMKSPFPGTGKIWVPLYGWQGIVWFPIGSLYGFVDAVDRILGLDNRAGVTYKLYLVDRQPKGDVDPWSETQSKLVPCQGAGNFSADLAALDWLRTELVSSSPYDPDEEGEESWPFSKAIFITTAGQNRPMGDTPDRPPRDGALEPPFDSSIQRLCLHWVQDDEMNRPDVAYLRIPEKAPNHYWYTNYFGILMERACRLLAGGRIANRPGRPAVPDAFIGLEEPDRPYGVSYGGLSFVDWHDLYRTWMSNKNGIAMLAAHTPENNCGGDFGSPSDRFNIYIPGAVHDAVSGELPCLLHRELGTAATRNTVKNRFLQAVRQAVRGGSKLDGADEDVARLAGIEVRTGGDFLGARTPGLVLSVAGSKDTREDSLDEVVLFLDGWHKHIRSRTAPGVKKSDSGLGAFPQFLVLRPIFSTYSLFHSRVSGKGVSFNPESTNIKDFRDLVHQILTAKGKKRNSAVDKSTSIVIRQTRTKDWAPNKPSFIVHKGTTAQEWQFIRKRIVTPNVIFNLSGKDDFVKDTLLPAPVGEETFPPVWGYRDIYATPAGRLYGRLFESQYPAIERHTDFQLLDAEAAPGFKTLQPWDDQKKLPRAAPKKAVAVLRGKKTTPQPKTAQPKTPPRLTKRTTFLTPGTTPGHQPVSPRTKMLHDTSPTRQARREENRDEPPESVEDIEVDADSSRFAYHDTSTIPSVNEDEYEEVTSDEGQEPEIEVDSSGWRFPAPYKLSAIEKAARLRERSFAHPLSVYENNNIPINAPPIESIMRVPGTSMPAISIGVSTPSEVRRLQEQYYQLRNINLLRTLECPYEDCSFTYPLNHPELVHAHVRDAHTIMACNFCEEPLFAHWPNEQRTQHFIQKHARGLLSRIETSKKDNSVSIPHAKSRVNELIESNFHFCSRCGRDHTVLNATADRALHDSRCYPGITFPINQQWTACEACGKHLKLNEEPHACAPNRLPKDAPYCKLCALPLGPFSKGYQEKHLLFCKGRGRQEYKFCPWEGTMLSDVMHDAKQHVTACAKRPEGVALPVDPWTTSVDEDDDNDNKGYEMGVEATASSKRKSAVQGEDEDEEDDGQTRKRNKNKEGGAK
ncbi:hypothetical protein B0T14DRAFT_335111 [Immersiella caudata]|uniref:Uncharacterized protein n=1 Tax=Immersiella caudata TaxID=314043 RepID=A0AA39WB89_9PEZI|nr:hypothetical protein B0T14DRAFT_335111 [Immersiella caudata]